MQLTRYEYFTQSEADENYREITEPYSADMDFAFFAVRFGWSLFEYEALTPVQRLFVLKEWERKTVDDSNLMKDAFELAISNAMRKKGKSPQKLWRKKAPTRNVVGAREFDALAEAMKEKPWVPWIKRKGD